jgi:hypothetical protein
MRRVVGTLFLANLPAPRRHTRAGRIRTRLRSRTERQRAPQTESNLDVEGLSELWSGRSNDDPLDCSGLEEFFAVQPRSLSRPPAETRGCSDAGPIITPVHYQEALALQEAVPPRAAPVVDDTLRCDGLEALFDPAVDAAAQQTHTTASAAQAQEPVSILVGVALDPAPPPAPGPVVEQPTPMAAFARDFGKLSRDFRHLSQDIDEFTEVCRKFKEIIQPQTMVLSEGH